MKLLLYTVTVIPLLPILFFLLFKRKSKERAVWVIFFYILYCLINEFVNLYLQQNNSPFTLFLFNIFTIVEFSFICYYFILLFNNKPKTKTFIKVLWIGFTIFALINILIKKGSKSWDSVSMGIESLIIIILGVYFIFAQIKKANTLSIYTKFHFWIAVTFVVYFSGTFFLNIMAESMRRNADYQMMYFIINIGFNILKNVLLAVAMTMNMNKVESKPLPDLDDQLFFNNASQ